jgi:hypothetical protein
MDVNLRKTATDTAYIVVGVGVLGFQQAQVRRREAVARATALRRDTRARLGERADRIKSRTGGCAANLSERGRNLGSSVGTQVKAGADAAAGAARSVDPRGLVEPVVGDLRVRVEPVVEQLRTISLPDSVSSLPDQVSKAIETGRNTVQSRLGSVTPPPLRSAASA